MKTKDTKCKTVKVHLTAEIAEYAGFKFKSKLLLHKIRDYGVAILLISFLLITCHSSPVTASDKWGGVDESVVEKVAKEYGREAREPFINTDRGDLLLFLFLLAGAIGGFVCGYYWRVIISEPQRVKGEG